MKHLDNSHDLQIIHKGFQRNLSVVLPFPLGTQVSMCNFPRVFIGKILSDEVKTRLPNIPRKNMAPSFLTVSLDGLGEHHINNSQSAGSVSAEWIKPRFTVQSWSGFISD